MGDQARNTTVVDASDATGDIRVRVTAANPPIVSFGPVTKSHYGQVECAVTLHGLLNKALGTLRAQGISERAVASAAGPAPLAGEAGKQLNIDERLERLSGFLDQARLEVESLRTGEAVEEARTAGRTDRVWMEARGGFLLQVRIDPQFYATCSSDVLAAEATSCLAELIDPSLPTGAGPNRQGPNGGVADD